MTGSDAAGDGKSPPTRAVSGRAEEAGVNPTRVIVFRSSQRLADRGGEESYCDKNVIVLRSEQISRSPIAASSEKKNVAKIIDANAHAITAPFPASSCTQCRLP